MSLYPSLEDMTVGKMAKVSNSEGLGCKDAYDCVCVCVGTQAQAQPQPQNPMALTASPVVVSGGLYPSLEDEYMGLELTQYRAVSL